MHDVIFKSWQGTAHRRRGNNGVDDLSAQHAESAAGHASSIFRKATCACGGGCPACQAKANLNISQPNDPAEIEADAAADKALRMPEGTSVAANETRDANTILRKCDACEEGDEISIQRKPLSSGHGVPSGSPDHVRNVISSGGRPLDKQTRSFFEPRFGYDLSSVRVHTDIAAGQSARAINAKAYTLGNNIVFGNNEYQPESQSGRHLIAHELSHVAQYSGIMPSKGGMNKSTETIFRVLDPPRGSYSDPLPPVSDRAKEQFAKLSALYEKVSAKKLPYTDGTVRAVEGVTRSMYYAILQLEGITRYSQRIPSTYSAFPAYHYSYTQGAAPLERPGRVFRVMDFFIAEIDKELDRHPRDDEYQEGNILGYWRKWKIKHEEAFEMQKLIESLDEEQPGDYPVPADTGAQIA